jgi:D-alanine-D-alanine ligase
MPAKLKVALLCGGQSTEHDVSVNSAKNVINALDSKRYDVSVIFIDKQGDWFLFATPFAFINCTDPSSLLHTPVCQQVTLLVGKQKALTTLTSPIKHYVCDIFFPVLHGAHGEDGTLQGLLELAGIPYVGAGVLASAICMDKDATKRLLQQAGIPTAEWLVKTRDEVNALSAEDIIKQLGLPLFVKPVNTGSSIGISKVKHIDDFYPAVELALQYDHRVLFEKFIPGREIECAVLGNEEADVTVPGEVTPHAEFYTYEAKYGAGGATIQIPAQLSTSTANKLKALAKQAFKVLCCEGMARIDFFVTQNEQIFLNEANTIPGFTETSMYPKLWLESGLSYSELLDKLITLGLARFQRDTAILSKKNALSNNSQTA